MRPPFLIRTGGNHPPVELEGQYPRLYSAAIRGGTTNVTPLTDLAVARILNRKLLFTADLRAVYELQNLTEAQLATGRQQVVDYLMTRPSRNNGNVPAPVDVAALTDFFSMPLTAAPGDPYFDALKRLHDSLMDSESIQGVEEHMFFGNDAPANPGAMLSLDFPAFCSLQGPDNGSMPKGNLAITLNPGGIAFGSFVNLPFTSGDLLSFSATHAGTQLWLFSFPATGSTVQFGLFEGRLFFVQVSILGTSSNCHAASELLLSGKAPSITALVRLFAQSTNNPNSGTPAAFQCSTPARYFHDGTNLLFIENNGALRINTPNGPALHLLSFDIKVNAALVVTAGQVSLIQPKSFQASRTFKGGLDDLNVAFTNSGQITGLSLNRPQNGQQEQQNCGTI